MSAFPDMYAYIRSSLAFCTRRSMHLSESYNDLIALPQAMTDSLQLRLRLTREDPTHRELRLSATDGTSSSSFWRQQIHKEA